MNSIIFQVIRHFLYRYLSELNNQNPSKIDPFFKNYFFREELIAILKWKYTDHVERHLKFDKCSNQELLAFIESDTVILNYYLSVRNKEIYKRENPKAQEVWETLSQLGLPNHYLVEKPTAIWDEYDRSNFLSLQKKAGRIHEVYGLYQSYVKQEDLAEDINHPNRFFGSQEKAQQLIQELEASQVLEQEEVHILSVNKAY